MKRGLLISERDHHLFRYLFEKKCVSISQIQRDVFEGASYETVRKRLWKLGKGKMIERRLLSYKNKAMNTYSLSKQGLHELKSFYPFIIDVAKLKSDKALHDLTLVDIDWHVSSMQYLAEYFTENTLFCCHEFHSKVETSPFIQEKSDRCMILDLNGKIKLCALEYESAAKSRTRYEKKFLSYRENPSVDFVFYVCEHKILMSQLIRIEEDYANKMGSKIYFSTLEDFLGSKKEYNFSNYEGKIMTLI